MRWLDMSIPLLPASNSCWHSVKLWLGGFLSLAVHFQFECHEFYFVSYCSIFQIFSDRREKGSYLWLYTYFTRGVARGYISPLGRTSSRWCLPFCRGSLLPRKYRGYFCRFLSPFTPSMWSKIIRWLEMSRANSFVGDPCTLSLGNACQDLFE